MFCSRDVRMKRSKSKQSLSLVAFSKETNKEVTFNSSWTPTLSGMYIYDTNLQPFCNLFTIFWRGSKRQQYTLSIKVPTTRGFQSQPICLRMITTPIFLSQMGLVCFFRSRYESTSSAISPNLKLDSVVAISPPFILCLICKSINLPPFWETNLVIV